MIWRNVIQNNLLGGIAMNRNRAAYSLRDVLTLATDCAFLNDENHDKNRGIERALHISWHWSFTLYFYGQFAHSEWKRKTLRKKMRTHFLLLESDSPGQRLLLCDGENYDANNIVKGVEFKPFGHVEDAEDHIYQVAIDYLKAQYKDGCGHDITEGYGGMDISNWPIMGKEMINCHFGQFGRPISMWPTLYCVKTPTLGRDFYTFSANKA